MKNGISCSLLPCSQGYTESFQSHSLKHSLPRPFHWYGWRKRYRRPKDRRTYVRNVTDAQESFIAIVPMNVRLFDPHRPGAKSPGSVFVASIPFNVLAAWVPT